MQDKELFGSLLTVVDGTASEPLGTIRSDEFGSQFIYLQGIASVVVGDWVTYRVTSTTAAVTARAISGSKGHLAIAMAAVVASKFGWFQIVGINLAAGAISGGAAAAGNPVFLTGTAGLTDDVDVADDRVFGATYTVLESSALAGVHISLPFVGVGPALRPVLTQVDTAALYSVGKRWEDEDGKVYIYLQGVASVITGDICLYRSTTTSANTLVRVTANDVGHVAVAMAAIVASRWGWFQIAGLNLAVGAISGGGAAADKVAYLTATAGLCDDVVVAGDLISGMMITVAGSSALVGAFLNYPFVTNESN